MYSTHWFKFATASLSIRMGCAASWGKASMPSPAGPLHTKLSCCSLLHFVKTDTDHSALTALSLFLKLAALSLIQVTKTLNIMKSDFHYSLIDITQWQYMISVFPSTFLPQSMSSLSPISLDPLNHPKPPLSFSIACLSLAARSPTPRENAQKSGDKAWRIPGLCLSSISSLFSPPGDFL
jgi:hypothetical protein